MSHPALQSEKKLSLLPINLREVITLLQEEILKDDEAGERMMRYRADFMKDLDDDQRQQVIEYLGNTPLYNSEFATVRGPKKHWLFFSWRSQRVPAKRRITWFEKEQAFIATSIIPQF